MNIIMFFLCALARCRYIPLNILAILARNKNCEVRTEVANNINTPAKVLAELSTDEYDMVRMGVVSNPNTPRIILVNLLKDRAYTVSIGAEMEIEKRDFVRFNCLL